MNKDRIFENMKQFMKQEDISRVRIYESESGDIRVKVDVHGFDKRGTKAFVGNIIALIRRPFKMNVIHGYNRGTVLKDFINGEYINKRITGRRVLPDNPGVTVLSIN